MNAASWVAMAVGALVYWLTRWQRNFSGPGKLTLGEYPRYEWPALIYGIIGGGIFSAIYIYAGGQVVAILSAIILGLVKTVLNVLNATESAEAVAAKFAEFTAPPMNWFFAFLFGAGGKSFVDRVPRIVNWFGAHVRLPGAK